jgi:hypothetical protein
MWQPTMVWSSRSAISLQNPVGRSSMTERADLGREHRRLSEDGVGSRQVSLSLRFVYDHQVPGHISGGKDMRRARPKLTVHLYVLALVDLDSGRDDVKLGGVGSRISRAACASVRTGTGPSLAAIPPNPSRVTSAVRAPSRAARSAAITPAGPAPITSTSKLSPAGLFIASIIGSRAPSVFARFG